MQPEPKIYKPGQWLIIGAALGAFIGLLVGKFAIGLVFGFFAGIVVDSVKRKAPKASDDRPTDDTQRGLR